MNQPAGRRRYQEKRATDEVARSFHRGPAYCGVELVELLLELPELELRPLPELGLGEEPPLLGRLPPELLPEPTPEPTPELRPPPEPGLEAGLL